MPENATGFQAQYSGTPNANGFAPPVYYVDLFKQQILYPGLFASQKAAINWGPYGPGAFFPLSQSNYPVKEISMLYQGDPLQPPFMLRSVNQIDFNFDPEFDDEDSAINRLNDFRSFEVNGVNENVVANGIGYLDPTFGGTKYNREGRACPRPFFFASSQAIPGFDFVNDDNYGYGTMVVQSMYNSPYTFIEYSGPQQITFTTARDDVQRLMTRMAKGGSRFTLPNGRVVNNCGFAANDPNGSVWVSSANVGTSDFQIPRDANLNSADKFRCQPSVFFRRTKYLRSVEAVSFDDFSVQDKGPGQSTQPLRIHEKVNPTAWSEWVFVVDGAMSLVRFDHDENDDIYTPLDCWNKYIAPLLNSQSTPYRPAVLTEVTRNRTNALCASKLYYLEYARCYRMEGDEKETLLQFTERNDNAFPN